jgi:hypothetical protein
MFNGQNTPDKDKDGCYFIDRSGQYFDHILNHLRDGTYLPPSDILTEVINEARYFNLLEYKHFMEQIQEEESRHS